MRLERSWGTPSQLLTTARRLRQAPQMRMPTWGLATLRKRRRDCNALLPADEFDEHTKTWKHATGFRRDLTADKLTMPDAPTRKKRPSATIPRRIATPAAARFGNGLTKPLAVSSSQNSGSDELATHNDNDLTKPLAVSSSRHGGSGESANEEEDELVNVGTSSRRAGIRMDRMKYWGDNDGGATMIDLDLEEGVRLEKKRRQKTQAARRSRIRKAEEVQKLQDRVAELEAEVIAGQHRLAQAECGASRLGGVFVCCEGAICCRCFVTRRAFTAHPNGVCISQPRDYGALLGTPTVASSFTIAPSYVPTGLWYQEGNAILVDILPICTLTVSAAQCLTVLVRMIISRDEKCLGSRE